MTETEFLDVRFLDLDNIFQDCWNRLVEGAHSAGHPFHCPSISTIADGWPETRTLVLRKALPEKHILIFHTDYRSPKVHQLHENPNVSWLFYDAKSRIQLRIKTIATIHHLDEISLQRWNESRVESKKCYLVNPAPSSLTHSPTDGLPQNMEYANLTKESVAAGYDHFAVVENKLMEIDWLFLHHDGHRRAQFILHENGIEKSWLIP